ncbi:GNAT family N-acetyltransferase [Mesorhizobium sp. CC13]|uniref:GNAT family N-acetyltransferase n=1 Tax=Mesorhizobium sp. CC13 TaxID=3029194 RepID=UPI003266CFDD
MVDAIAARSADGAPRPAPSKAVPAARAVPATGASVAAYRDFARTAVHAPPQSPDWVSAWTETNRTDAILATLYFGDRPVVALALEVSRVGPFKVARFMGGRHANGNFAVADKAWLATATAEDVDRLMRAIAQARPDVDLVALERLLADCDGLANPLLRLPSSPSPNVALAVDLDGGFEAVLGRTPGKKKAKRHRSQERKYEAVGGAQRFVATTEAETGAMLDAFFAMKAQRFRAMGIADVFEPEETRWFYRKLFAKALGQERPAFVLHGLKVGDAYRAVTGSSWAGSRFICEFGAIADDELAHVSPGEYLFFDNIGEACGQGFGIYDFSVGDEPYKRTWCDLELRHADVYVPLTVKGRAYATGMRSAAALKRAIKGNQALWAAVKRLRTMTRGKDQPDAD